MMIMFLACAGLFCFWLEFISTLFCDANKYYNIGDVLNNSTSMAVLKGNAINWEESTSYIAKEVNKYKGQDVTPMFPFFMALQRNTTIDKNPPYSDPTLQKCIYEPNNGEYATKADKWLDYKLTTDPGYDYRNGELLHCPYPNQTNVTGAPCFNPPDELMNQFGLHYKGGKWLFIHIMKIIIMIITMIIMMFFLKKIIIYL